MRFISRLIFTALIMLCWSGLAVANITESTPPLDASVFRAVTNMQLDSAFAKFISLGRGQSIQELAGPSSMDCSGAVMLGEIETCLVTIQSPILTYPAALAQH